VKGNLRQSGQRHHFDAVFMMLTLIITKTTNSVCCRLEDEPATVDWGPWLMVASPRRTKHTPSAQSRKNCATTQSDVLAMHSSDVLWIETTWIEACPVLQNLLGTLVLVKGRLALRRRVPRAGSD
jgi:hypothetical protein